MVEVHVTARAPVRPSDLTPAALAVPVCGLNVTSLPLVSTAVHWVVDGQDRVPWLPVLVTPVAVGPLVSACVAGLNVISLPPPSSAVHCVVEGHEIE